MNATNFQVLCLSPTGWILVVLVLLLAGCGGIPIGAHLTEEFVGAGQARSLIGMTKDTVQERFVDPDWEVDIVDKTYLIYAASGEVNWVWEIWVPILVLPAEAYDRSGISTLYCAAFEVDQNDKVVRYDSDWVSFCAQAPWPRLQQCMGKMIPKEELIAERDRLRHEVTTKGDAKAYRKL